MLYLQSDRPFFGPLCKYTLNLFVLRTASTCISLLNYTLSTACGYPRVHLDNENRPISIVFVPFHAAGLYDAGRWLALFNAVDSRTFFQPQEDEIPQTLEKRNEKFTKKKNKNWYRDTFRGSIIFIAKLLYLFRRTYIRFLSTHFCL